MKKRKEFEKTPWIMGNDGLYINQKAQPDCKICNGFGVVDSGSIFCVLETCPACWNKDEK